jgi:hypothetical protein
MFPWTNVNAPRRPNWSWCPLQSFPLPYTYPAVSYWIFITPISISLFISSHVASDIFSLVGSFSAVSAILSLVSHFISIPLPDPFRLLGHVEGYLHLVAFCTTSVPTISPSTSPSIGQRILPRVRADMRGQGAALRTRVLHE